MAEDLLDELQQLVTDEFTSLNAEGINFGGRESVQLEIWGGTSPTGINPLKRTPTAQALVSPVAPALPLELVVIDFRRGDIRKWDDAARELKTIGDIKIEIARLVGSTPITRTQLLGQGLAEGQLVRFRLGGSPSAPGTGGELFSLADGSIDDADGLSWGLVLKKVLI